MASYFGFDAFDIERRSEPFVFISYKSEDCERVTVYARYLHDHGVNVWYDNGLRAGSDWESYLMSVIERPDCRGVLLFLSAKVAGSTVIPLETTQARACKKPTVAIHLEPGLDVEKLLSKAIKVYVEQRQSIFAWTGDEENICRQVLTAAHNAMEDISSPKHTGASADELWNNALVFLHNTGRSRRQEDADRAIKYLVTLTEEYPADYRGWLGRAMSCCLPGVNGLADGAGRLRDASRYYSYVVSAGADEAASAEYTRAKTELWNSIISQVYSDIRAADVPRLQEVKAQLRELDKRFGHTEASTRRDYERLLENIDYDIERIEKSKEEDCEWFPGNPSGLYLYKGSAESYTLPSEYRGRRVTQICANAFKNNTSLREVVICDGVEVIETGAFRGCSSLERVCIPKSVRKIGLFAFEGCASLKTVELPDTLEFIGAGAFRDCKSLETVTLPSGMKKIGHKLFTGCKKLVVHGTGGYFSPEAKCARKSRVRYVKIKK